MGTHITTPSNTSTINDVTTTTTTTSTTTNTTTSSTAHFRTFLSEI